MWWFSEFNSVSLPRGSFATTLPRTFIQNRMGITGSQFGEYDLDGTLNRLGQQAYTYEFTLPSCKGNYNTALDAILAATRRSGTLKKTDGRYTRIGYGKVASVQETTGMDDWFSGTQRIQMQFSCEPFWYDNTLTTVSFTSATSLSLRNTPNIGNARAIKHVILTITSAISGTLTINGTPQDGGHYYGEWKYGKIKYGTNPLNEGFQLIYGASTVAPLVIDAGNSTVRVGGVDAFSNVTIPATQTALIWVDPGDTSFYFSQAVTGNLKFRSAWL